MDIYTFIPLLEMQALVEKKKSILSRAGTENISTEAAPHLQILFWFIRRETNIFCKQKLFSIINSIYSTKKIL